MSERQCDKCSEIKSTVRIITLCDKCFQGVLKEALRKQHEHDLKLIKKIINVVPSDDCVWYLYRELEKKWLSKEFRKKEEVSEKQRLNDGRRRKFLIWGVKQ